MKSVWLTLFPAPERLFESRVGLYAFPSRFDDMQGSVVRQGTLAHDVGTDDGRRAGYAL